jgi:hypothetical protein
MSEPYEYIYIYSFIYLLLLKLVIESLVRRTLRKSLCLYIKEKRITHFSNVIKNHREKKISRC